MNTLSIRKPFDAHEHFRQGPTLSLVAPYIAKRFFGAIAMPNTEPPITSIRQVDEYYNRIIFAADNDFLPLMTMYLTDSLDPAEVARAVRWRKIAGVKYYPRGLTTNSASGVNNPASLWKEESRPFQVLSALADEGGVLLIHAAEGIDAAGEEVDPFDQERSFLEHSLPEILRAHPTLKISLEHLSTEVGAAYMRVYGGPRLACTLTPHHLLLDRRDMLRSGMRPHRFWWPILQRKEDRDALRQLASEGHPFVFLGSDSAPHYLSKKENACCSGGVFTAHAGIELYAEAFDAIGCLEKLEAFASENGPRFYGIEPSEERITLVRERWIVGGPTMICLPDESGEPIVPFRLGEAVEWKLA